MHTAVPLFCSQCGRALEGRSLCACGHAVERPVQEGALSGPGLGQLGEWARLVQRRVVETALLRPSRVELPLPAVLLSLLVRSAALALLLQLWLRAEIGGAIERLGLAAAVLPLGELELGAALFLRLFLALVAASAGALGVLYLQVGSGRFRPAAGALADAQWVFGVAALGAWLAGQLWAPLSAAALVAGVAWGQALLALGLAETGLSYGRRLLAQMLTAGATVMVLGLILRESLAALL